MGFLKSIKIVLISVCFLFHAAGTVSQNSYYKKDSLISYGVEFIDYGNYKSSKYCYVKIGDQILMYSPDEVSEYGYNDGRVYVAKRVTLRDSVQTVFLERLVDGKFTLYYYKGAGYSTYFVSQDSLTLRELPYRNKERTTNYREKVQDYALACNYVADAARLVGYNRAGLTEFFSRLNKCESKHFPFLRVGFSTGLELIGLVPAGEFVMKNVALMNFRLNAGASVGIFADIPVFPTQFSLFTGAYVSKHAYSYFKRIDNKDVDFLMDNSTVRVPLMLKYSFEEVAGMNPYLAAGGIASYHFRNQSQLFETSYSGYVFSTYSEKDLVMMKDLMYGFVTEAGFGKRLTYRNYLSLGLRYAYLPGSDATLSSSEISLILSVSL